MEESEVLKRGGSRGQAVQGTDYGREYKVPS